MAEPTIEELTILELQAENERLNERFAELHDRYVELRNGFREAGSSYLVARAIRETLSPDFVKRHLV